MTPSFYSWGSRQMEALNCSWGFSVPSFLAAMCYIFWIYLAVLKNSNLALSFSFYSCMHLATLMKTNTHCNSNKCPTEEIKHHLPVSLTSLHLAEYCSKFLILLSVHLKEKILKLIRENQCCFFTILYFKLLKLDKLLYLKSLAWLDWTELKCGYLIVNIQDIIANLQTFFFRALGLICYLPCQQGSFP